MTQIIDYPEDEFGDISGGVLLLKIWLEPTRTLAYILRHCPNKYVNLLFIAAAASANIEGVVWAITLDWLVYGFSFFFNTFIIWVMLYIYNWVLAITGAWIGGRTGLLYYKTIFAWSLLPTTISLLLIIGVPELISSYMTFSNLLDNLYFNWVPQAIILGLGIWSIVILIKGVRLIQGFTVVKSLLNIIFASLLTLPPLYFLGRFLLN